MEEINWSKYGFSVRKDGGMQRDGFPLVLDEYEGFLVVWHIFNQDGIESQLIVSEKTIPATSQAVVLLLKAFNVPKNP
jgi:hypothetical protein